jgi:hypothetical protein
VRERSFATPFVLGLGPTVDGATGLVLGCQTVLPAGRRPTDLGESVLGTTDLVECDERIAGFPGAFDVLVAARDVCSTERLGRLRDLVDLEKPAHTSYRVVRLGVAGFVVGAGAIVGQSLAAGWDPDVCDPATFGIALGNGPPRPAPLGRGMTLGRDSRLASRKGPPRFVVEARVGRTTRVGP